MKKLTVLFLALLIFACGAPVNLATETPRPHGVFTSMPKVSTAIVVDAIPTQEVGVVIVDGLTVRQCPETAITDPEQDCKEDYYLSLGAPVMGTCRHLANGDVWLEFGERHFVAVVYGGVRFVEGVCE